MKLFYVFAAFLPFLYCQEVKRVSPPPIWKLPLDRAIVKRHRTQTCVTIRGVHQCFDEEKKNGDAKDLEDVIEMIKYFQKHKNYDNDGNSNGEKKKKSNHESDEKPDTSADDYILELMEKQGVKLSDLDAEYENLQAAAAPPDENISNNLQARPLANLVAPNSKDSDTRNEGPSIASVEGTIIARQKSDKRKGRAGKKSLKKHRKIKHEYSATEEDDQEPIAAKSERDTDINISIGLKNNRHKHASLYKQDKNRIETDRKRDKRLRKAHKNTENRDEDASKPLKKKNRHQHPYLLDKFGEIQDRYEKRQHSKNKRKDSNDRDRDSSN